MNPCIRTTQGIDRWSPWKVKGELKTRLGSLGVVVVGRWLLLKRWSRDIVDGSCLHTESVLYVFLVHWKCVPTRRYVKNKTKLRTLCRRHCRSSPTPRPWWWTFSDSKSDELPIRSVSPDVKIGSENESVISKWSTEHFTSEQQEKDWRIYCQTCTSIFSFSYSVYQYIWTMITNVRDSTTFEP